MPSTQGLQFSIKTTKKKTKKTNNTETIKKCDNTDKRQDHSTQTESPKLPKVKEKSLLETKAIIQRQVFDSLTSCENCELLWEHKDDMKDHLPWCQENRPT